MNAYSLFKHLASVVAIVFTLIFTIKGHAQNTASTPAAAPFVIGQQIDYEKQRCNEAITRADAAEQTFNKTCGDAKLRLSSSESCITRAESCQEGYDEQDDTEEEGGFVSSMLGLFGGTSAIQKYAQRGCPDMTASEGREKERDLKTDIKDKEREIKDLQKDIAELQKSTSDKFTQLNERIAEADAEFKEQQAQMKDDEITAASESRRALSEANESIRALTKDILTKEKQLAEATLNKATEMSKFTDFVIKNECSAKIRKTLKEMTEANKKKGSSTSLAKINNIIKRDANQGYLECWNTMVESRNKVRLQFDNSIKTIEEDLALARQSLTEAQNSLKELTNSLETAKQNAQTRVSDAYQNYLTKRQNLAQELQLLSQNSQTESQQLQSQLMQANSSLNMIKQDQSSFLASGRGGTKVLDDVIGDYNAFKSADAAAVNSCKNGEYRTRFSSTSSSQSGRSGDASK